MGTVTGFTADRMLEIENDTVVDVEVNGSGHLILISRGGTSIDAGYVVGPKGDKPNDAADITQGVFDLNRIPVMTNSKMPVPVTIPSNTSLNTYQTTGFYYQTTLAFATLALAYPLAGVGGLLRVTRFDSGNYVYQEWFSTDGKNNFVRSLSGTTWSGWVRVALEGNTVSFAHLTLPGDGRLRLPNTNDASISSTLHAFQIGSDNGTNLRIDNNEIQGVNNGAVSPLYLQNDGGDLGIGTATSKITVSGLLSNPTFDLTTENLNNIKTPGIYRQPLTASATQTNNYPGPIAGLLEVFAEVSGANMVWQRFSGYGTYAGRVFQRGFYNGTWTAWSIVSYPTVSQALTWTSSFNTYSGSTAPTVTRDGNVVTLDGTATPASASAGSTISAVATLQALTIPTGYTPIRGQNYLCQGSSFDKWDMTINNAGVVAFGRYGPGTAAVNTWMPFSITFITADPMPGSWV